jgi:hypothetical protein
MSWPKDEFQLARQPAEPVGDRPQRLHLHDGRRLTGRLEERTGAGRRRLEQAGSTPDFGVKGHTQKAIIRNIGGSVVGDAHHGPMSTPVGEIADLADHDAIASRHVRIGIRKNGKVPRRTGGGRLDREGEPPLRTHPELLLLHLEE